jgi:hypothetical protein
MTIWRTRIVCWIPEATNTHSDCVMHIAFPLQQWFHERASGLRYTYFARIFYGYPQALSANSGILPEIITSESVPLNCVLNLSFWER